MQHSDPKNPLQIPGSDRDLNATVISWIKTLPINKLNDTFKQLPPSFKFTREMLFIPMTVQKENCIFFNGATIESDLFHTILDRTPTAILDEAVTYAEPFNQFNTLHIVFSLEEKMLSQLLQKISIAACIQAVEAMLPEGRSLLFIGLHSNKFKYFIEKVDSTTIDRWINTPLFMLTLLTSKNDVTLLSVIQQSSTNALNQCLSTGYIETEFPWLRALINKNSGFTKKTINALYQKLTDQTVENSIFLHDWDLDMRELNFLSLYKNSENFSKTIPTNLNATCNLNSLFFLSSISDALVLKLLETFSNDGSEILKQIALYNPAFYNALEHRLIKIKGLEFVCERVTQHPILLTRINENLINELLINYPGFREKIPAILNENKNILTKAVRFFREDKLEKRYQTTQLKIDDELTFLSLVFAYLTSSDIMMISPLAKLVIEYCISDPRLFNQINLSSKTPSLEDKPTKSSWGPLKSLFKPKPSYQFSSGESKGVQADTRLAKNLLSQGQPLPDTLRPV